VCLSLSVWLNVILLEQSDTTVIVFVGQWCVLDVDDVQLVVTSECIASPICVNNQFNNNDNNNDKMTIYEAQWHGYRVTTRSRTMFAARTLETVSEVGTWEKMVRKFCFGLNYCLSVGFVVFVVCLLPEIGEWRFSLKTPQSNTRFLRNRQSLRFTGARWRVQLQRAASAQRIRHYGSRQGVICGRALIASALSYVLIWHDKPPIAPLVVEIRGGRYSKSLIFDSMLDWLPVCTERYKRGRTNIAIV